MNTSCNLQKNRQKHRNRQQSQCDQQDCSSCLKMDWETWIMHVSTWDHECLLLWKSLPAYNFICTCGLFLLKSNPVFKSGCVCAFNIVCITAPRRARLLCDLHYTLPENRGSYCSTATILPLQAERVIGRVFLRESDLINSTPNKHCSPLAVIITKPHWPTVSLLPWSKHFPQVGHFPILLIKKRQIKKTNVAWC